MLTLLAATLLVPQGAPPPVDFATEVLPVLSDSCFRCHGPDARTRKGKLRLDTRAGAFSVREKGAVLVPGDPARSLLVRRITAADPDERMPPAETGKRLTAAQVATLRRWVEEGARWSGHWAYAPPRRPAVPRQEGAWPRNGIDHFVLARLRREGLAPAPAADRRTLARRVSLDLTGLLPEPDALAAFLADGSPDAYERLVDRLLASPHYGERMAMVWLDAARYADTDGYQADATRDNWPWRDWVVDAYDANMRFDRFTELQFAGDLLPDATPDQVLATCFHRNHMANGEGGRHPEESRVDYVIDRVNTVGTVWLGLTLGCAQCHDHKYDPISQREYYALSAYFDSIAEDGRAGRDSKPFLAFTSKRVAEGLHAAEAWLAAEQAALATAERDAQIPFAAWLAARAKAVAGGHGSWHPLRARELRATNGATLRQSDDATIDAGGANARHEDYVVAARPELPRLTGMRLHVLPDETGRLSRAEDGHVILTNLKVSVRGQGQLQLRPVAIAAARADYQNKKRNDKDYGPVRDVLDDDPRTGWSTVKSDPTHPRVAVFAFAAPVVLAAGEELVVELRHRSLRGHSNLRRFRIEVTDEAGGAARELGPTPQERLAVRRGVVADLSPEERAALFGEFTADDDAVQRARRARDLARQRRDSYAKAGKPVQVTVLEERARPRTTHVLLRGEWNKHGAEVTRALPAALGGGAPGTRLGLARALVAGDHPLTARVAVNRYWQMYFGDGLVRTPEDFGLQGERPTHPQLLDWLAREFVASGWDVKHVQRLIVTSATYRQSSRCSAELRRRDPQNRLLARAGRFRLPSWMIRDVALQASGLLSRRRGGPPVHPYQPPDVWADSTMGRFHYTRSVGDDLYRRSLYSFWRRMVAPTGMFDASKRRTCQVRVVRTNTPLHALTLMNDTTFVEAARVLAEHAVRAHAAAPARISAMFERLLCRPPDAAELRELEQTAAEARRHYAAHPEAAQALARQGDSPPARGLHAAEVATFTLVAGMLLNLDEALTHE